MASRALHALLERTQAFDGTAAIVELRHHQIERTSEFMLFDRKPWRSERRPLGVAEAHLASQKDLTAVVSRFEGGRHRPSAILWSTQAMCHRLVEHDKVTGIQRNSHAGMRHDEFHMADVKGKNPEQAP